MANKYEYVKRSIEKRRHWINSLKNVPCKCCEQTFKSSMMDFHHRDPKTKLFEIGKGSYRHGIKALEEEISKCDIICKECHKKYTSRDRLGGKSRGS